MTRLILHTEELTRALALQPGETLTIARPMEPQPPEGTKIVWPRCEGNSSRNENIDFESDEWSFEIDSFNRDCGRAKSPFGKPGQEFWVQEEFKRMDGFTQYKSDLHPDWYGAFNWQSAKDMPQWASRLTLIHKGTEVKQEDGKWKWYGKFEVVGWV